MNLINSNGLGESGMSYKLNLNYQQQLPTGPHNPHHNHHQLMHSDEQAIRLVHQAANFNHKIPISLLNGQPMSNNPQQQSQPPTTTTTTSQNQHHHHQSPNPLFQIGIGN